MLSLMVSERLAVVCMLVLSLCVVGDGAVLPMHEVTMIAMMRYSIFFIAGRVS